SWKKVDLPVKHGRIADINLKEDTLLVLTRHFLLKSADGKNFETAVIPEPVGYEHKTGLFNTLWELHSGELAGLTGKLIVDLLGLVTILLSVTGLLYFIFPVILKRVRRAKKPVTPFIGAIKINLRWHIVVGYIFVVFLVINTLAGIHLRPPLLIPVAGKKVGIIPGTHLDSPNPWFDKLRRVEWNESINSYIFSTSEGFFFAGEELKRPLRPAVPQPPVSIMGLNVFKKISDTEYITGSFTGIYLWNTGTNRIYDFFTGEPYHKSEGMSSPVGRNMAAGIVEAGSNTWWFDYNRGAMPLTGVTFPGMPAGILDDSPVSLWNVALEVHTGRIFEHITGPFYILYVPLSGLCLIMVLISGFFIWWKSVRKKKPVK
ncbi:MAG: PepSY-associated TM helix domain-containing protein, partial [Prolixibacteraceae bacterium]|nr:PepSY-associated TM helix domain-containing protein [Prolixibacteraceae bacterium]